jgi:hypothetical protein
MSLDDRILVSSTGEPDSQFLPGTKVQFAWDSVSIGSALACWRRYFYTVIEGLVPKAPGYAIALEFGILFHSAIESYHRKRFAGAGHDEALHSTIKYLSKQAAFAALPTDEDIEELKAGNDEDDDGITLRNSKIRTRYHLGRAVVWYLDYYAEDTLKTICLPSGAPAVELSFRIPTPIKIADQPLILCGHIDRAVEFEGVPWVSDYKTTKSLSRQFFSAFELSHQMTGYNIAGQVILDQPVRGIWIDGIALQVGGIKLGRAPTRRTAGQVKEYWDTLEHVAEGAERAFDTGFYPMNTASCYFCEYKEICKQAPEYRERYISQYYNRRPGWNPLANR